MSFENLPYVHYHSLLDVIVINKDNDTLLKNPIILWKHMFVMKQDPCPWLHFKKFSRACDQSLIGTHLHNSLASSNNIDMSIQISIYTEYQGYRNRGIINYYKIKYYLTKR